MSFDLVPVMAAKQRRGSLHGQHVPGHPNLQYQGLGNFIRVRIKVDRALRPYVPAPYTGKGELTKGLGTNKINEAIRLSRPIIVEFERMIEAARQHLDVGRAEPTVYMRVRHEPVSLRAGELSRGEASQIAAFVQQRFGKRVSASGGFGATGGFRLANASEYYAHVPVSRIEATESAMAEAAPGQIKLADYTWQAALEQWALDTGATDESKVIYRGHLRDFFAAIPSGLMGDVTPDHFVSHKEVLQALGKANKTVNNRLGSVRSVFRNAKANRKIARDPTLDEGQPVIHKLKVEKNRKGYSREQFPDIIAKALQSDNPVIKYLWLIGATIGNRIGELADAKVSAVKTLGGHPVIVIDPEHRNLGPNGKPLRLKTPGSKRINPLHSVVVNGGFLGYCETIRSDHGPDAPLFPMLRVNRFGKRSDEASRICNEWLRETIEIEDKNLCFHSLRHSVKTFLRGRIGDEATKALTGHAGDSVSANYGETEIEVLRDAIEEHIPVAPKR